MSDYKTPNDKLIDAKEALAMNVSYKAKRLAKINAENNIEDHCSTWFSLEDLEGYINYVKQAAKEKGIVVDGIRFYFGVYPESSIEKSKIGKTTMFMCPTTSCNDDSSKGDDIPSDDITEILGMNYGDTGNPPKNDYGD